MSTNKQVKIAQQHWTNNDKHIKSSSANKQRPVKSKYFVQYELQYDKN